MDLKVKDGWYILTLDKAILVLTKDQFVEGLKRGKWWKRKASMATRMEHIQNGADRRRPQLDGQPC